MKRQRGSGGSTRWRARFVRRGWLGASCLAAALASVACGQSESPLSRRFGSGGSGASMAGGDAGSSEQSSGGITQVGKGGASGGVGGRTPDEAPGETVLTFVHGIVDSSRAVFCFVQRAGDEQVALGMPGPAAGLGYGDAWTLRGIDGLDFENDTFGIVVLSGELELLVGLDCTRAIELARREQAAPETSSAAGAGGATGADGSAQGGSGGAADMPTSAGGEAASAGAAGSAADPPEPPRLRVGELPQVPAGSLAGGRSYLLVADGCIGGPAFDGRNAQAACGARYTPRAPSLAGVLVALSRQVSPTALGLQVVHASLGTEGVDVSIVPPDIGTTSTVAQSVAHGAIVPRVPQFSRSATGYGLDSPSQAFIELSVRGTPWFKQSFESVLQASGLETPTDGRTYAVVLLGPSMNILDVGFWNDPAIRLVPTDP